MDFCVDFRNKHTHRSWHSRVREIKILPSGISCHSRERAVAFQSSVKAICRCFPEGYFLCIQEEGRWWTEITNKVLCPRFEVMLGQIKKQNKAHPVLLSREKGAEQKYTL